MLFKRYRARKAYERQILLSYKCQCGHDLAFHSFYGLTRSECHECPCINWDSQGDPEFSKLAVSLKQGLSEFDPWKDWPWQ